MNNSNVASGMYFPEPPLHLDCLHIPNGCGVSVHLLIGITDTYIIQFDEYNVTNAAATEKLSVGLSNNSV